MPRRVRRRSDVLRHRSTHRGRPGLLLRSPGAGRPRHRRDDGLGLAAERRGAPGDERGLPVDRSSPEVPRQVHPAAQDRGDRARPGIHRPHPGPESPDEDPPGPVTPGPRSGRAGGTIVWVEASSGPVSKGDPSQSRSNFTKVRAGVFPAIPRKTPLRAVCSARRSSFTR